MKKELFEMTCNFEFNEDNELNVSFEVLGNSDAQESFGEKQYDEYLSSVVKILKPITDELNDLTAKFIKNDIKNKLENSDELINAFLKAFKEYMKGDK